MKRVAIYTMLCASLSFSSCDMFEVDNYDEPKETIKGEVVDVATGERILTDQGGEGIRVRLIEQSFGPNASPNPDFNCMSNGTFQNTKIFKGEYNVRVDGPFIPIVREDERGVPIADESKILTISGVKEVKFEVEPFLKVEWVGIPVVAMGRVAAKVKVTRGVDKAIFEAKIKPMFSKENYKEEFWNVTDIQLFVSYSSSVGYRANDSRWSSSIEYAGAEFNTLIGQPISISSKNNIPSGRKVFVRAAARINFDTPIGTGTKRWNYSEPIEVIIP